MHNCSLLYGFGLFWLFSRLRASRVFYTAASFTCYHAFAWLRAGVFGLNRTPRDYISYPAHVAMNADICLLLTVTSIPLYIVGCSGETRPVAGYEDRINPRLRGLLLNSPVYWKLSRHNTTRSSPFHCDQQSLLNACSRGRHNDGLTPGNGRRSCQRLTAIPVQQQTPPPFVFAPLSRLRLVVVAARLTELQH